jgi:precorrin-6B methylase 1
MNEYAQQIKGDLADFQMSVQRLSSGIQAASYLWRDPKYSELASEITQIANQSRTVLVSGDKCCDSIEKFFKVAEEQY